MTRKKLGESYTDYQKRVLCENSSKLGSSVAVTRPQCLDGKKEYIVTVKYDEFNNERDTSKLCETCKDRVKKEAEQHGYNVEITEY